MDFTIEYGAREAGPTVMLPSAFSFKDVSVAADRLRSWAKVRDVTIAGPAYLRMTSDMTCEVHVPVSGDAEPHPETGIHEATTEPGETIRVHDVRFGEARTVFRELQHGVLAADPANLLEFHSVDGDFYLGDVIARAAKPPRARPASLALAEAAAPAAFASGQPVRVVTVARQHGTGGEAIAAAVAEQLGLRLVDYEVFRKVAEEAGVSPADVEMAARHRGLLAKVLDALARSGGAGTDLWMAPVPLRASPLFTSGDYRALVEEVIRELAEAGDVLILGHGAQLVLGKRADTFRVLIAGGQEQRAARAVAQGMPLDEAREVIAKADEERVAYFREFYHHGWLDPATYDLVVNTDRISVENATAIIVDAIAARSDAGVHRVRRQASTGDGAAR